MIRTFLFVCIISLACSCADNEPRANEPSLTKEEQLKSLLKKYPDSLIIIENLVQYHREKGDYTAAIKLTDEAIAKKESEAAYWDMKATLHFENGDTLAAIKSYNRLISLEPLVEHIIALGSVYAQFRDPKSLDIADELLRNYKASAERDALLIKGMYYNFTGEKQKAILFFDQCLELDYTYVLAYREKAIALYDLGMYKQALIVLETAVKMKNSFEEGYFWMGKVHEKLGNCPDAAKAYQMALMYDKDYAEAAEALKKLGC